MDKTNLLILLRAYYGQLDRLAKDLNFEEPTLLNHLSKEDLHSINTEVNSLLLQNEKFDVSDKNFDLTLAFRLHKLPREIDEILSQKIYERISLDKYKVVNFLKQTDSLTSKPNIPLQTFKEMEQKVSVYSYLMNFVCKKNIRSNKTITSWEIKLNQFTKSLTKKIEFLNKTLTIQHSPILDCYEILDYDSFKYYVPNKSLYWIIKDLTQESKDSLDLYLYYLAINGSSTDKKNLKQYWAFKVFLNDLKSKENLKKI